MADPLLCLDSVHTHIGPYHILQGVDFTLTAGETTMLLGRNGAGKTTTLRSIMGVWKPSSGGISFDGRAIAGKAISAIATLGVGYVPEEMAIFGDLTVAENMRLAARSGPCDAVRLAWLQELFPPLKSFWHQAAGNLSGGQKQMLAIGRALIEPRRLLLVDEPTKGLAPGMIARVIEAFRAAQAEGATILMVEQNFHCARQLGDRVLVMDMGRIVHRGAMADLAADQALQTKLLGLSLEAHQ
jgi:branched-chain amino acid transport system ATP-binding protein